MNGRSDETKRQQPSPPPNLPNLSAGHDEEPHLAKQRKSQLSSDGKDRPVRVLLFPIQTDNLCKSSDFKADKEKGARKKELSRVILGMNYYIQTSSGNKQGSKTGQSLAKTEAISTGASRIEEEQTAIQYALSVCLVHMVH